MESYYDNFIHPYTHKQLASLYEVSWMTLQKWMAPYQEEIGKKNGHFYSTARSPPSSRTSASQKG